MTASDMWLGWTAWHPVEGFADYVEDEGETVKLYSELSTELAEEVKELNEDDPEKRWRAVRVIMTKAPVQD